MNARIILEVPAELKNLFEPVQKLLAGVEALRQQASGTRAVDYREVEGSIREMLCAIERGAHGTILAALEVDRPRVRIEGRPYSRVGYGQGTYYTLAGPVEVKRALYREVGQRNARTVNAISLRTGAVAGGWLPQTAAAMAHLLQGRTSREAHESAQQLGVLPYCHLSFNRVPHQLAERYRQEQAQIEDELIEELEIPDQATSVSMALDRVSVPMEVPVKRPVGRPRKGAPKKPVARVFRMAYCGTLTLHGPEGESLHTIRYASMPGGDGRLLAEGMAVDLKQLLDRRPDLRVALLADGAPEMWNLLGTVRELGIKVHELVDFWHLMEKLSRAAVVLSKDQKDVRERMRRWKRLLRRRSTAAATILDELLASGKASVRTTEGEAPVSEAISYLRNHMPRMNYAQARRKKLPIGSGNVEATCKTLVSVRMKRCGSRWKQETGENILQLRALALSDRFQPAMDKFFATQRMAVRPAA